ncbi:MAG TPA: transketolase [Candidatus Norongarragalinales archaeon]|nr:transketolase [Candidatus Norongarragalinales archaeon]
MPFQRVTGLLQLRLMANTLRQDLMRMLCEAKSGHSAGPLDLADFFSALYFNIMNHDPQNPKWDGRDRFVLSCGHVVPVQYAALAEAGYFPKEELMTLRKLGTRLHGHPHNLALPGIESSSGPLGQGTSQAVGKALAAKMEGKKHFIYCLTSDGEHNEGQPWEAWMFAAKYKLSNLIVFMDRNYIQIDGNTESVMPLDPLEEKFRAFNVNVISIDGNDIKQILDAVQSAKAANKFTMILLNTVPGKGVSFMEGKYEWHGRPPNPQEMALAIKELESERQKIEGGGL